jgi:chromosome segregation ATPase
MDEHDPVTLMPPEPDLDELESAASILDQEVARFQALRMAATQIHTATNYVRHLIEQGRTVPQRLRAAEEVGRQMLARIPRLSDSGQREAERQQLQREAMQMQLQLRTDETEQRRQTLEAAWQELLAERMAERAAIESELAEARRQHEAAMAALDAEHAPKRAALERDLKNVTELVGVAGARVSARDRDAAAAEGREKP